MTTPLNDYACPQCGYDGPHLLFPAETPDEPTLAECGDAEDCGAEFEVAPPEQPVGA